MNEDLLRGLHWAALQFIVLVLCVALHEFGHAWTADRRGDPLPRKGASRSIRSRTRIRWERF